VKRRGLVVLALLLGLLALAVPAQASGDDYPYRGDTVNRADRWGFTTRQCVSFAAWRLAQNGHPLSNVGNAWGSAYHWDDTARARGITVSSRPKVGAIAQWNGDERSAYYPASGGTGYLTAGPYGHVAWVRAVYSDGSVLAEQYNVSGNRSYSQMHLRAPRYLYVAG
jgi:surface antigen